MLRLAWRNVWRNLRRSLITVASMAFGLAALMFGQSMIKSVQLQLVEKATGSITGHIQIQHRSIKDYKFPDRHMDDPAPVEKALAARQDVHAWGKRIIETGLVSTPAGSVGVMVMGVEPQKEKDITTIAGYLTQGTFLGPGKTILMGEKLAQRLEARLGEKVVVMAQASDGSMGAEVFRIAGLIRTGSVSFDSQIVWVPLKPFQDLLVVGSKVNKIVVRLKDVERAERVRQELAEALGSAPVQVLTWKQVDHEILGVQKFQDAILNIVLVIVFAIVSLGVLNTLLMSFFERVREFGVIMAIGARPAWVTQLVLAEALILGTVGTALGLAFGSLLIAWYGARGLHLPIGEALSYFLPFPSVIYLQFIWPSHLFAAFAVHVTTGIAAVAPALRAGRLKPAQALRHV